MKDYLWLINIRANRNLTQEDVAELASIDRSYYTKIEKGKIPSVRVAKRIADVLEFEWTRFFTQDCDEIAQAKDEQAASLETA